MKVFLMRHGIALDVGAAGIVRDADRPLSAEGRRRTAEIAAGLRAAGATPARFVSSPLVRARETAAIVAHAFGADGEIGIEPGLAPGGDPRDWLMQSGSDDLLAVGHMPGLSDTLGFLLAGTARGAYDFRKGGIACVAFEGAPRPGRGALEWFLPPRLLRQLGSGEPA